MGLSPRRAFAEVPRCSKAQWAWPYVFPARTRSVDPRSGMVRRHHAGEKAVLSRWPRGAEPAGWRWGLARPLLHRGPSDQAAGVVSGRMASLIFRKAAHEVGFGGSSCAHPVEVSLVLANVMARLFDLSHPPNFLCAGEASVEDPFALGRAAAGAPPADVEPTLLSRLLAVGPATVRREVSQAWR